VALLDSPELHADPNLKLLDVATGRQNLVPSPAAHAFLSVAFTADGRLFVIGTPNDKALKLWQVIRPSGLVMRTSPVSGSGLTD
jgi:hypothetical protein